MLQWGYLPQDLSVCFSVWWCINPEETRLTNTLPARRKGDLQTSLQTLNFSYPPRHFWEHVRFRSFPPSLRLVHGVREGTCTFSQPPHFPKKCHIFFIHFFYVRYLYFVQTSSSASPISPGKVWFREFHWDVPREFLFVVLPCGLWLTPTCTSAIDVASAALDGWY